MVWKLEEVFHGIVKQAIDSIADKGECDFLVSIAVPLPSLFIAEMLGIHKKDRERFHQWSDHTIAEDGNFDDPEIVAKAGAAFSQYTQYCTKIIQDRRANPRDDLVSIPAGSPFVPSRPPLKMMAAKSSIHPPSKSGQARTMLTRVQAVEYRGERCPGPTSPLLPLSPKSGTILSPHKPGIRISAPVGKAARLDGEGANRAATRITVEAVSHGFKFASNVH